MLCFMLSLRIKNNKFQMIRKGYISIKGIKYLEMSIIVYTSKLNNYLVDTKVR